MLMIDSTTYIVDILYFAYIGKDYLWVVMIGLVTSGISSVMFLFFAPESPLWQLKTGKIKVAQETLKIMSKVNKVDC